MEKTYHAMDVANWFIDKFDKDVGDVITYLKLQKLLYYAEAWTQLLLNRTLFEEQFEAWAHGPVVREVFHEFKDAKWSPLEIQGNLIKFDEDVQNVLTQVLKAYGGVPAKTLENMTHNERPWIEARGGCAPEQRCTEAIHKASIKNYFQDKYGAKLNA